ncbi:MAG: hypothetical protein POELPBGB_00913 [Bacteroidia bacterium]|nr:hypothetical protein [Bacteroidia bacterium]
MKTKKTSVVAKKKPTKKAVKKISAGKKQLPKTKKITKPSSKKAASKPIVKAAIKKKKNAPLKQKKKASAKKTITVLKKKSTDIKKKVAPVIIKKEAKQPKKNTVAKKNQPVIKQAEEIKPDPVVPGWSKVQFEYFTRSSVGVLYNSFSTSSGLASWFADYVDSQDNLFSFNWEGSEEKAIMIESLENEYVRYRWLTQPQGCFFEFRIRIDAVTNEVALVITDYVQKGDEKEAQLLWDSQVHELMHILGS